MVICADALLSFLRPTQTDVLNSTIMALDCIDGAELVGGVGQLIGPSVTVCMVTVSIVISPEVVCVRELPNKFV
jgi:hypothetical protein